MPSMDEQQLRDLAHDLLKAWNAHDVAAIGGHLSSDVTWTDPALTEPIHGREEAVAHLTDTFRVFPDLHLDEDTFRVLVDTATSMVATTWTSTGTHRGSSKGLTLPPTGRTIELSGATVVRLRGSRICDYEFHYDMLDLMQQLGALPRTDRLGFKALVMADLVVTRAADRVKETLHR